MRRPTGAWAPAERGGQRDRGFTPRRSSAGFAGRTFRLRSTRPAGLCQVRVQAARALLGRQPNGDSPEEQVRETVLHLDRIREAEADQ